MATLFPHRQRTTREIFSSLRHFPSYTQPARRCIFRVDPSLTLRSLRYFLSRSLFLSLSPYRHVVLFFLYFRISISTAFREKERLYFCLVSKVNNRSVRFSVRCICFSRKQLTKVSRHGKKENEVGIKENRRERERKSCNHTMSGCRLHQSDN